MKVFSQRKAFFIASAAAAVLAVCLLCVRGTIDLQIVSYPFELLGKGLRALSLSGSGGNVAAVILYALCCALPALIAGIALFRDRRFTAAKLLLLLLSGYSFAMLYFFINPNLIAFSLDLTGEARELFLSVLNIGMAFAFYGLLLLCVAVRLIARARREEAAFYRAVRLLCAAAGCALAFLFFGFELAELISAIQTGGADAVVGVISLILHGGLYGCLYAAVMLVYGGAERLKTNLFAEENAALLKKVSRLFLADFLGGIAVCVLLNVLNFALSPYLQNMAFEFDVSVWVAAIAAVCLFACKLLLRAIELYEENRLTI